MTGREMSEPLMIVRVQADENGESRIDDIALELEASAFNGGLSAAMDANAVQVRTIRGDFATDLHVAPQRQFIINLAGTTEIEASNGDRRTLVQGKILLVEDTTGRGHKARKIDGDPLVCMIIRVG